MAYTEFSPYMSGRGILKGTDQTEDIWKVATDLQRARLFRRSSQPALSQTYRRDSFAREPIQNYRRDSFAREPIQNYRRDSVTREPSQNYRRGSAALESMQNYRRHSIAREQLQSYRRDSITRDELSQIYRRNSLLANDLANTTKPEATGRRGSDADDINWIAKYQKSDHHTDRLVNAKLENLKAVGKNISTDADVILDHQKRTSAFSAVAPANQTHLPPKPFRYEGTNKLTVYLQPPKNYASFKKLEDPGKSPSQLLIQVIPSTQTISRPSPPRIPSISSSPASAVSSLTSRVDYRSPFQRPSSIATAGIGLSPQNSTFRQRSSTDSSLFKTSRSLDLLNKLDGGLSKHSESRLPPVLNSNYPASLNQPYRPSFTRAPSVPPSLLSGASHGLSSIKSGLYRGSMENLATDVPRRSRASSVTVGASEFSAPNYRRSVDFGAPKSSSDTFRSPLLSSFESDFRRRSSYDSPLSSLSPMSPMSPMSPLSSSSLPPPSERIFGSRTTHSFRRNRKSLADN